jgi:hypothetical protein
MGRIAGIVLRIEPHLEWIANVCTAKVDNGEGKRKQRCVLS